MMALKNATVRITALTSGPTSLTLVHPTPALWTSLQFLEHSRHIPALWLLLFLLPRTLFPQTAAMSNFLTSFKSLPNVIFTVRLSLTVLFNPTTHSPHPHLAACLILLYPDLLSFFQSPYHFPTHLLIWALCFLLSVPPHLDVNSMRPGIFVCFVFLCIPWPRIVSSM